MGDFVNRTTKALVTSGNSGEFPSASWIAVSASTLHADFATVGGYRSEYANITGDVISLMNQTERDAVDAANLSASRDAEADVLDNVEGVQRAFALVVLDELNLLRAEHALAPRTIAQLKTAVRGKLGNGS